MNIIVITVDTLRYDYIGANNNGVINTPNIDDFASESILFDNHFASSYPTIPHRTDVITGEYGSPFNSWSPLRFDVETLPEIFARSGYSTQLIHDTPHLVNGGHNFDWPFHAWTFIRGAEVDRPWVEPLSDFPNNWKLDPTFDFVDQDLVDSGFQRVIPTYARANMRRERHEDWNTAKLFSAASKWVHRNSQKRDFFLWVDCFDPHEPWDIPPKFAKMYVDNESYDGRVDPRAFAVSKVEDIPEEAVERIRSLYAGKVSWMDKWFGVLWDAIKENDLRENTAILLTSDHGTRLAEERMFGKGSDPEKEQEIHTPLMLYVPGYGNQRIDMIAQPQDIFTTLANLADINVPDKRSSHDLLENLEKRTHPRKLALSGSSVSEEWAKEGKTLFVLYKDNWYLEFTAKPENCSLRREGSLEDVSNSYKNVVKSLHSEGIDELERRGADPAIIRWLKNHGESEFPTDSKFWEGFPDPKGYDRYFYRSYNEPEPILEFLTEKLEY